MIKYLWIQRKYRVLQIAVFYVFALLVLVFRICQYAYTLRLLSYMLDFDTLRKIIKQDFAPEVYVFRRIGFTQVGADYSKFALGFY